ncbi:hypothetical protein Y013_21295 [Rhodococcus pyridinivorans SB3094]|uniref:Uncharacterized protein n=1 Tax=Rhodococcus pyridinivorans SB3094 TaxID=1435356 RepID=V9XPH2_9NOCA|nr:hypothetical protein Y013_21295 [Rhodococcus pyridinivorans SB3094]
MDKEVPESQLAAAAGAEEALLDDELLDDELLDDELVSLDEELLEFVAADSLAVLPLRESVR